MNEDEILKEAALRATVKEAAGNDNNIEPWEILARTLKQIEACFGERRVPTNPQTYRDIGKDL